MLQKIVIRWVLFTEILNTKVKSENLLLEVSRITFLIFLIFAF